MAEKIDVSFNGYMWTATYPDYYDGAPDAGQKARMIGAGKTKDQAITDLKNQAEELGCCLNCGSSQVEKYNLGNALLSLCVHCEHETTEHLDFGETIERAQYREGTK